MYVVIRMFDDLQDYQIVNGIKSYHRYKPGDTYPREYPKEGMYPSEKRIRSLLTCDNAQHVPLIAVPKPPEPEEILAAAAEGVETGKEPEKAEKPAAKASTRRTSRKPSSAKKTAKGEK